MGVGRLREVVAHGGSTVFKYLASRLGEIRQKNVFLNVEPQVDFNKSKSVNLQHLQSEE